MHLNKKLIDCWNKKKKWEKEILQASDANLVEFKTTIFEEKTLSKVQKFLKSTRKAPAIPPTFRKGTASSANGNERFGFFNDYSVGTFARNLRNQEISFERRSLNRYTIDHNQVRDIMKELNVSNSTGDEKIETLVLRMCHHLLSKSLTFIFKTCLNKKQ